MKLTFKEINSYVPKWNGNRKETATEQIKVYWRYPNSVEVGEIRPMTNPKVEMEDGKISSKTVIEIKVDGISAVKMLVEKIENLIVDGILIDTGEKMVNCSGLSGLVQEVSAEILAEMDKIKGNSKNS